MKVFAASNYRQVMQEKIREGGAVRGYQARLAEAAGVHSSYISRVLADRVELTPDQAASLARFWNFDGDETDFFIDLVLLERSASKDFRARLGRRLEVVR